METELEHTRRNSREYYVSRYVSWLIWIGSFVLLYIFFRYVHPAIIWDGDDWHTNEIGTAYILFDLPSGNLVNYNILSNALGVIAGYLTAYVAYPITGDYIMSYAIVDAIFRAGVIVLSNYVVWRQLKYLFEKEILAWIGIFILFISAFVFMKTTVPSSYLYWTYNRSSAYYYGLPSYLSGAFSVFLIRRYFMPLDKDRNDLKTLLCNASLIIALYFLMFSFLPAAVMVAVVSFIICAYDLIRYKNLKNCIRKNWACVLAMILLVVKLWFEYSRTFSSGYLSSNSNIFDALEVSSRIVLGGFRNMHILFKLIAWGGLILSTDSIVLKLIKRIDVEETKKWLDFMVILLLAFFIMLLFFILFGAISLQHISAGNLLRNDTVYCMQFSLILLVSVSWMYLFKERRKVCIALPVILCMMICVCISSDHSYGDSVYTDTTPKQKYEVMSAVVSAIQEKSENREDVLVVHMPPYMHYGSPAMSGFIQKHQLADRYVNVYFAYDASPGKIWFE